MYHVMSISDYRVSVFSMNLTWHEVDSKIQELESNKEKILIYDADQNLVYSTSAAEAALANIRHSKSLRVGYRT